MKKEAQVVTAQTEVKKYSLLINGEWREASTGETSERRNPADQTPVAVLPMASEGDLDLAVEAARKAFDEGAWSARAAQRVSVLRKAAARIRAESEMLVPLLSREVGKPLFESRIEVLGTAAVYDA
jgi:betaine-aldehyde dehydrogenase